jgi:hypothetical protein
VRGCRCCTAPWTRCPNPPRIGRALCSASAG